jgi:hypothetical protein
MRNDNITYSFAGDGTPSNVASLLETIRCSSQIFFQVVLPNPVEPLSGICNNLCNILPTDRVA